MNGLAFSKETVNLIKMIIKQKKVSGILTF